jgi:hypothetical protein
MKLLPAVLIFNLIFAALNIFPTQSRAKFTTDPPATVILLKRLTGYSNYGQLDSKADILYSGESGEWNFRIPEYLTNKARQGGLVVEVVSDDHYSVNTKNYTWEVYANDKLIQSGSFDRFKIPHGKPYNGPFSNWQKVRISFVIKSKWVRIKIRNSSKLKSSDWIGIDSLGLEIK